MSGDDDEELVRRAQALVGTVVNDKWKIERLIGFGGMAVVYQAIHRNKKRAAIKLLHPQFALDPRIVARFLREGYAANTVGHPGAVRIDDDDVTPDGSPFLVMELLEGETVEARRLRHGGRLIAADALPMIHQLLDVLIAAHEKGVVHRDLKPDNLFLNRDGELKVLDFGIARLLEFRDGAAQTQTGSLLGTPAFMAPEQARARWDLVDARTDLWAVGATLFTLLTGRFVHEAETLNEALALAVVEAPRPLASVLPSVPPLVAELVDRALAYAPSERFQDARTMQVAVETAHRALTGEAPPQRAPVSSLAPVATTGSIDVPIEIGATLEPDAVPAMPHTPPHPMLATAPAVTAGLSAPKAARKRRVSWLIAGFGAVLVAALSLVLIVRSSGNAGAPPPSAANRPESPLPPPAPTLQHEEPRLSVALPVVEPESNEAPPAPSAKPPSPVARARAVRHSAPAPASSAGDAAKKRADPFAKRR